jgi:hypothetical protein
MIIKNETFEAQTIFSSFRFTFLIFSLSNYFYRPKYTLETTGNNFIKLDEQTIFLFSIFLFFQLSFFSEKKLLEAARLEYVCVRAIKASLSLDNFHDLRLIEL